MILEPVRRDVPIYLAAIGPQNVALGGEIADGWLPLFFSPLPLHGAARPLARRRGRKEFQVAPLCPVLVDDDVQQCRDMLQPMLALYLGGMGARGKGLQLARAALRLRGGGREDPGPLPRRVEGGGRAGRPGPSSWTRSRSSGRRSGSPSGSKPGARPGVSSLVIQTRQKEALARDGGLLACERCLRGRTRRSGGAASCSPGAPRRRRGRSNWWRDLLIRRAAGGVIHQNTLTLEQEFDVLRAAHEAGVKVPEPIAYLGEIEGREAFVMARIEGETIGRRIVEEPTPWPRETFRGGAREDPRNPAGAAAVPRAGRHDRALLRRARLGRRAASGDRARAALDARKAVAKA